MSDSCIKIKEKISLIRDVMDYTMRECMIKAYEVAFTDKIGQNWFDIFVEKDKKKKDKSIAKYKDDNCEWTQGIKHADFVATMKMMLYSDDIFQKAFFEYWKCEKEKKDIQRLARNLNDFRNKISHINDETNYTFQNPDEVIEYIRCLAKIFEGLKNEEGQPFYELIDDAYKKYRIISKTFDMNEVIKKENLSISVFDFIRICKRNKIEINEEKKQLIVDDIDKVVKIVELDKVKNLRRKKVVTIALVMVSIFVLLITCVMVIRKMGSANENNDDRIVEAESVNPEFVLGQCRLVLKGFVKLDEGIKVKLMIYNGKSTSITEGMCLETYFKIIDVNNNEKLWGVDLCIDEEIGSMDKQLLVYILPWEEFDITKDELKKILLANCELVDKDEFYNEKSSD